MGHHRSNSASAALAVALHDALRLSAPRARALLAGSLAMAACSTRAAVFTVTTSGDPGSTGLSLRQAVAQANAAPNSTVQFDPALSGSTITLANGEIAVSAPMTIRGPGAAKLTISGNGNSRVFNIAGTLNVPYGVTVAGVSITNGHSAGSGGGVLASDISLALDDVIISNSVATNCGGILAQRVAAQFSRVQLLGNRANADFGALCLDGYLNTYSRIVDSVISGNRAISGGGGEIGQHSALTIKGLVVRDNVASADIGGLLMRRSGAAKMSLYMGRSTITNNAAPNGDAGGLDLQGVYAIVAGSVISGNVASSAGGILLGDQAGAAYPTLSSLRMYTSTVAGNDADSFGGGIEVRNATQLSVRESLISGNFVSAPSGGGGGIALRGALGDVLIFASTIHGNYAYRHGGGIGIFDATAGNHTRLYFDTIANNAAYDDSSGIYGAGTPRLNSCIVANNASHLTTQDMSGSFSASFSLIKTPGNAVFSGAGNFFGFDPALAPLAVNGGPTLSMLPAAASLARDAADPSYIDGRDQRGLPRVSGGRADIGAVERQTPEEMIFRDGFGS